MSDIRLAIHFSDPSLLTRGSRGVLPEPVPADLETSAVSPALEYFVSPISLVYCSPSLSEARY